MKTIIIDGKVVAKNVRYEIFLAMTALWDLKDIPWICCGEKVILHYKHGDLSAFERAA